MMRLWLAVFLIGICSGMKYIEEREVTTSTGKTFNCFYTIQYTAKGVVSTKKSSVTCTPDKNGGSAMPVFDLPGVGPTSIQHSVKKGKDSVQDYSAYTGPLSAVMPMNCSCRVPLAMDMMGSGSKPNASKPKDDMELMLEDMCEDGGKPEKLKELMAKMNITKEMIQSFMMAEAAEKEEMIQQFMMTLPEEKKKMLQKLIEMIQMMKPMDGGMKPPMGGKPGGSDCQQQLMEMICSKIDGMGGKPGFKPKPPTGGAKPGSMQDLEAGVMQMMMDMAGLNITDQGEAALNVNCECIPMKQK